MGRTFRASSRTPTGRELLKEEKDKSKVRRSETASERDRSGKEKDKKPGKKSLQDVCKDLKLAAIERVQQQVKVKQKASDDVEFQKLMAMMYGPQVDPREPLLQFEGQRIPRPVFEDLLTKAFQKNANRLPVSWENEKDYHAHCVAQHWVEVDDTAVLILSRVPVLKTEAA